MQTEACNTGQPMPTDNFSRFLGRAENYDRYRPPYPDALYDYLRTRVTLGVDDQIADIAAGTGIFTEKLARWGHSVYVVKPNEHMIAMAKHRLADKPNCSFSDGVAEATGLPAQSVRLILAAQSFHWFDATSTKAEFMRIGTDGAYTGIVWNKRRTDSPFGRGYEEILQRYGRDYPKVSHSTIGKDKIDAFFAPSVAEYSVFPHTDWITYETARGRLASYSFMPEPSSSAFADVEAALEKLFEANQMGGIVSLTYDTWLYLGQLKP